MTKFINSIENERRDIRNQTLALNTQTKEFWTQLNDEKKESRRQNGELMALMSKALNELNIIIMKLINKFSKQWNKINYEFIISFICQLY